MSLSRPRCRLRVEPLEGRDLMAVLFVSAGTGSDGSGSGSAAAPFQSIQKAVNTSASGDTIRVAAGTYGYVGSQDVAFQFLGTNGAVTIVNKNLTIEGGYNPANLAAPRDPGANPTVIDPQGLTRGVLVLSTVGTGGAALAMSGFTVRNGFATGVPIRPGDDKINAFGGGLSGEAAFLNLSDMRFENNVANGVSGGDSGGAGAGGGVAVRSMAGTVVLNNVTFAGNRAVGGTGASGGGLAQGGGLFDFNSPITGTNLTFTGNSATAGTSNGAGRAANGELADAQGGGAVVSFTTGTLSGVLFSQNTATGGTSNGAGGGAFGGGLFSEFGTIMVSESSFRGNVAQAAGGGTAAGVSYGGGLHASNTTVTLNRVTVVGNSSIGGPGAGSVPNGAPQGGGVAIGAAEASKSGSILNSVIAGNMAFQSGTGGTNFGGGGGGVAVQGPPVTIVQTTIADNAVNQSSMFGSAVVALPGGSQNPTVDLAYSIIANHGGGQQVAAVAALPNATIRLTRDLFSNNVRNTNSGGPPNTTGAVTFDGAPTLTTGDPRFVSPGGPNFDYHIQAGSAAADAATGSNVPVDITNTARVGIADLGAFEVQSIGIAAPTGGAQAFTPSPPPPPPAAGTTLSRQTAVGTARGVVRLIDASGAVQFSASPFGGFQGEVRTATGDFNRDGTPDVVAGTGPGAATSVVVIDGKTQQILYTIAPFESTFTGGVFVAAGDITGDGVPDVIVTPDLSGGPRVRIFDGTGGQAYFDYFGIDDANFRGGVRTAVGDVNGDGAPEIIVAAGFGGGPRVTVWDGNSLRAKAPTSFANFFVFEQALRNGSYVGAGDVNGDGKADLIAGGGPGGAPRVLAVSGADITAGSAQPATLANFFSGDTNARGGIRVTAKDLDGDALADIVTGSASPDGARAIAYTGKTLAPSGTPPAAFTFNDPDGGNGGIFVG